MQSYILDATSGFYRNGIIELFMHNADGMKWYRADDVDQRIAELGAENEKLKHDNMGLRWRIADIQDGDVMECIECGQLVDRVCWSCNKENLNREIANENQ